MSTAPVEFSVSSSEIRRRMVAFTSLILSLFIGIAVFAFVLFPATAFHNYRSIAFPLLVLGAVLVLSRTLTVLFFRRHRKTRICLSGQYLERVTLSSGEKFLLKDITHIHAKRTTRGNLREVGIRLRDGSNLFIDGLDRFEEFYRTLLRLSNGKPAQETTEPLDFDHPLFYPVLGLVLGFGTVYFFRFLIERDTLSLRWVYGALAAYIFSLGCYFLIRKPLAVRYGSTQSAKDLLWGLFFIGASVLVGVWAL